MTKLSTMFGGIALWLAVGISMPAYAQDASPHPDDHARPEDRAAHDRDKQAKQEDKQEKREDKRGDKDVDKGGHQEDRIARQEDRHEDHAERREDQREDRRGHIPDDRFRANFGREHRFRVGRPVIVEGQPRFQFGGYWFIIAEPWPVGWGYDDDVFVDYVGDGYYLFSPVHPGVQIAINVVF